MTKGYFLSIFKSAPIQQPPGPSNPQTVDVKVIPIPYFFSVRWCPCSRQACRKCQCPTRDLQNLKRCISAQCPVLSLSFLLSSWLSVATGSLDSQPLKEPHAWQSILCFLHKFLVPPCTPLQWLPRSGLPEAHQNGTTTAYFHSLSASLVVWKTWYHLKDPVAESLLYLLSQHGHPTQHHHIWHLLPPTIVSLQS